MLGRRAEHAHHLSTDISYSPQQAPLSLNSLCPCHAMLLPIALPTTLPQPRQDYLGGAIFEINRPRPRTISTMTSFLATAFVSLIRTSYQCVYDENSKSSSLQPPQILGGAQTLNAGRHHGPTCAQEAETGLRTPPEAVELAEPPEEGTNKAPMNLVDSEECFCTECGGGLR